jgi:hypothetical protein
VQDQLDAHYEKLIATEVLVDPQVTSKAMKWEGDILRASAGTQKELRNKINRY